MAMITISSSEISEAVDLDSEQILKILNDIGMPCEEKEGEMFVEITPNRPDLFSVEGIARVLNLFVGKKSRVYNAKKSEFIVKIDSSVGKLRPYLVAAVIKNVHVDESLLKSLMQLQEKLHETIGRKRKKIAIGIHDFDTVKFPLIYKFVKNEKFIPLDFNVEMDVKEILKKHPKGEAYAHLVNKDYPMIYDQEGVISFPPIINCERTRVTEKTVNLLIESTGTHKKTLNGALNIIICALADRGGEIYEINVDEEIYPKLAPKHMLIDFKAINKLLGENFSKKQVLDYLVKMGWQHDNNTVAIIPPYRMDILHYVDIAEDVAIGHGYNEFTLTIPNFFIPASLRYNYEDIRQIIIGMGFIEVVNYVLTNEKRIMEISPLRIINPKTEEFTLLRTSIINSLLDNLALNKMYELPIKIFEIGRVYENGEKIKLAFAISAEALDFSTIRGVLQSLFDSLEKKFVLKSSENKYFIYGRYAEVYLNDIKIGCIGEIAPKILEEFGIQNPVGICEIELGVV